MRAFGHVSLPITNHYIHTALQANDNKIDPFATMRSTTELSKRRARYQFRVDGSPVASHINLTNRRYCLDGRTLKKIESAWDSRAWCQNRHLCTSHPNPTRSLRTSMQRGGPTICISIPCSMTITGFKVPFCLVATILSSASVQVRLW